MATKSKSTPLNTAHAEREVASSNRTSNAFLGSTSKQKPWMWSGAREAEAPVEQENVETEPRRGRGRPRKDPSTIAAPTDPPPAPRGRGRPRKYPIEEPVGRSSGRTDAGSINPPIQEQSLAETDVNAQSLDLPTVTVPPYRFVSPPKEDTSVYLQQEKGPSYRFVESPIATPSVDPEQLIAPPSHQFISSWTAEPTPNLEQPTAEPSYRFVASPTEQPTTESQALNPESDFVEVEGQGVQTNPPNNFAGLDPMVGLGILSDVDSNRNQPEPEVIDLTSSQPEPIMDDEPSPPAGHLFTEASPEEIVDDTSPTTADDTSVEVQTEPMDLESAAPADSPTTEVRPDTIMVDQSSSTAHVRSPINEVQQPSAVPLNKPAAMTTATAPNVNTDNPKLGPTWVIPGLAQASAQSIESAGSSQLLTPAASPVTQLITNVPNTAAPEQPLRSPSVPQLNQTRPMTYAGTPVSRSNAAPLNIQTSLSPHLRGGSANVNSLQYNGQHSAFSPKLANNVPPSTLGSTMASPLDGMTIQPGAYQYRPSTMPMSAAISSPPINNSIHFANSSNHNFSSMSRRSNVGAPATGISGPSPTNTISATARGLPQYTNQFSTNGPGRGQSYGHSMQSLPSTPTAGQVQLAAFDHTIDEIKSRNPPLSAQAALRIYWIRAGCEQQDRFFLLLQQVFATSRLNPSMIPNLVNNITAIQAEPAMQVLENLLGQTSALPHEMLAYLAGWPTSIYMFKSSTILEPYLKQMTSFLPTFGSNWKRLLRLCSERDIPPTMQEIVEALNCPRSLILPRVIFDYIHRFIAGGTSVSLTMTTSTLFMKDQARYLARSPTLPNDVELQKRELYRFASTYSTLRREHDPNRFSGTANPSGTIPKHPGRSDFNSTTVSRPQASTNAISSLSVAITPTSVANQRLPPARAPQTPPVNAIPPSMTLQSSAVVGTSRNMVDSHRGRPRPNPTNENTPVATTIPGMGPIQSSFTNNLARPTTAVSASLQMNTGLMRGTSSSNTARAPHTTTSTILPPFLSRTQPSNTSQPSQSRSTLPDISAALKAVDQRRRYAPFHKSAIMPPLQDIAANFANPRADIEAFHQTGLQSIATRMEGVLSKDIPRLYQVSESTLLKPHIFSTNDNLINLDFEIPADLYNTRASTSRSSGRPSYASRTLFTSSHLFILRCAETSTPVNDSDWASLPTKYPSHIFITLNDHALEIRRKRNFKRDLAIDITDYLLPTNSLEISVYTETSPQSFGISVESIAIHTHAHLLTLPTPISATEILQSITSTMAATNSDDDMQLMTNDISISITCPFLSKMFNIPARGKSCRHRECFDLESFLETRALEQPRNLDAEWLRNFGDEKLVSAAYWVCPICGKDARPQELVVDGFLRDVRERLIESDPEARMIVVSEDGSWKVKVDEEEGKGRNKRVKRDVEVEVEVEVIELD